MLGLVKDFSRLRGEETQSADENRIKDDASRELTDLWREAVEHQAAM